MATVNRPRKLREFDPHTYHHWPITQLAECEAVNFEVPGSSPGGPAIDFTALSR